MGKFCQTLGKLLEYSLSYAPLAPEMSTDLRCKRAMVFDSVNQVKQKFGAFDPKLVLRLLSVYSTALYGSPLWKLDSAEHKKLNRSWNIAVKMI